MSESVEKSFAKIRELTVEGLEVIIEERLAALVKSAKSSELSTTSPRRCQGQPRCIDA